MTTPYEQPTVYLEEAARDYVNPGDLEMRMEFVVSNRSMIRNYLNAMEATNA